MLAAGATTACHRAPPLLTPTAAFWQQRAPDVFRVRVETTRGPFVLAITRAWAPIGVDHFYNLVRAGYYDDSRFSRVVPGFIAQFGIAGEPPVTAAWATRRITDDPVVAHNERGTIAYAMTGPNTRTTQLYINLRDNTRLDAEGFAPLGLVVQGMDVVDSLYGGYGETSGGGVRAGKQGPAIAGGNAYFDRAYPKLDRLISARIESAPTTPTIVYVVRHGEKAAQPAADPPLSADGVARSIALADSLRSRHITAVITTQFIRTRELGAPTAAEFHLTPIVVPAASPARAVAQAVLRNSGGTVLVVGHSNTVAEIVGALGAPQPPDLCDAEYDAMFVVTITPAGRATVVKQRYGKPTPVAAGCANVMR